MPVVVVFETPHPASGDCGITEIDYKVFDSVEEAVKFASELARKPFCKIAIYNANDGSARSEMCSDYGDAIEDVSLCPDVDEEPEWPEDLEEEW